MFSGAITDEDLTTAIDGITNETNAYTTFRLTGSTADAILTTGYADIVPLTGNRPNYNQFTGGAWQQTQFDNNDYGAVFVYVLPQSAGITSQSKRILFVQPQQVSQTLATIQALTSSNINLNGFANDVNEYICVAKIIIRYVGGGTTNWSWIQLDNITGNKASQVFAPAGNYLSSVATDGTLSGNGTVASPLSVNYITIPNVVQSVVYDASNRVTTMIETLSGGNTLERRYRYYAGGSNQDGSIDIMEVHNTLTSIWIRVTYNYTAGLLTSTTHTIISAWTI
jgi:hypothetical protein